MLIEGEKQRDRRREGGREGGMRKRINKKKTIWDKIVRGNGGKENNKGRER